MCLNLVDAGLVVVAVDLRPKPVAEVVAAGGRTAADATAVAARANVLLTSLLRPDRVEDVMPSGVARAALRPTSVWAGPPTNRCEFAQKLAYKALKEVTVLDSPVTGAVDGARDKHLTLLAGGSRSDLDCVAPVLGNLGSVICSGSLSSDNVAELNANHLWLIHAASIGEGFALGMAATWNSRCSSTPSATRSSDATTTIDFRRPLLLELHL